MPKSFLACCIIVLAILCTAKISEQSERKATSPITEAGFSFPATCTAVKKVPHGSIPAETYISGRECIARTLKKLASGESATLVVIGDSITEAALLPEIGDDKKQFAGMYATIAAMGISNHFGYSDPNLVWKKLRFGTWNRVFGDDTKVGNGLSIVILGAGGETSSLGPKQVEDIISYRPDLVIWQLGVNDAMVGDTSAYRKNLEKWAGLMKGNGIEIVIGTPTPNMSAGNKVWRKGEIISEEAWRIARKEKCALVDIRQAFSEPGFISAGSLFADELHPNLCGHRVMGRLFQELFTRQGLLIEYDKQTVACHTNL